MRLHFKKIVILSSLIIVGTTTILSFKEREQPQPKKLKNLKVFPATATYQQVDHAMDQFKVDLGVRCNYCHAPSKENPKKMDMASDENPLKEVSRQMMRMTEEMNKKYIATIPHSDTTKVQLVTCNTCHRGAPKPFGTAPAIPQRPQKEGGQQNPPPPPPSHN